MKNLVFITLETGGTPVSTGIYAVGLIAMVDGQIVDTLTIGLPINANRMSAGMGQGYACISDDFTYIQQFKQFMASYPYPFVAHNATSTKAFLVNYGWVDAKAIFYDTSKLFRTLLPKSAVANYALGTLMAYYDVQVDGAQPTTISELKGLVEIVNRSGILGEVSQPPAPLSTQPLTELDTYILNKHSNVNRAMSPKQIYKALLDAEQLEILLYSSFEEFELGWYGDDYTKKPATTEQMLTELTTEHYSSLMQKWVIFRN